MASFSDPTWALLVIKSLSRRYALMKKTVLIKKLSSGSKTRHRVLDVLLTFRANYAKLSVN